MSLTRRSTLGLMAGAVFAPSIVRAESFPSKVITLVVPYPAGGPTDAIARFVAQDLSVAFGHNVVVDNRAGASGAVGTRAVAHGPADGYTIVFGNNQTHGNNMFLLKEPGYDAVKDFAPLAGVGAFEHAFVVRNGLPAKNIQELIALAKSQPGKLSYASVGTGSPSHIAGELFKLKTGIDMVHVPYKGGGPAVTDVIGGQVPILFVSMPAAWQHVKSGRLRALAVTSDTRSVVAPDLPTLAEAGVADCVVNSWYGAFAPAKMPAATVQKLNAALVKVLQRPDIRDKLLAQGAEAAPSSAAELDAIVKDELRKWEMVIRDAKIRPE